MRWQQISLYPGTYTPGRVGIIKFLNGKTMVNRRVHLYNGISNSTYYRNCDNSLGDPNPKDLFNETHTNGMQFTPMVDNHDKWLE